MEPETYQDAKTNEPLGTVRKVNDDGTVLVDFDMNNPDAASIVAAWFTGGLEAANAELRRIQGKPASE